jgi:hypothetical protein
VSIKGRYSSGFRYKRETTSVRWTHGAIAILVVDVCVQMKNGWRAGGAGEGPPRELSVLVLLICACALEK